MFVETKREGEIETKREPWRQLLLEAAAYMEKHGHCIGAAHNLDGAVCIIGALSAAVHGEPSNSVSGNDGCSALDELRRFVKSDVAQFSDGHAAPEVIAAMRACANSQS